MIWTARALILALLGLKMLQHYAPVGVSVEGFSRRMLQEAIRRQVDKQSLNMFLLTGDSSNPHGASFHFEGDTVGYLVYPPKKIS